MILIEDWPRREFVPVKPIDGRLVEVPSFAESSAGSRTLIQALSTQYLGLAWDRRAIEAIEGATNGLDENLWCSLGSNFLGGTHESRLAFECEMAARAGMDQATAFASGWAANYAIGEALPWLADLIVSDRRNHNSIIHGISHARKKTGIRLEIVDLLAESLDDILERLVPFDRAAVFWPTIEGITGEALPVEVPAHWRQKTLLISDECHSFPVVGRDVFEYHFGTLPDARLLGLSKGFGTQGGVVCGSASFIDVLQQHGSPWIFSAAVPPILWRVNSALLGVIDVMQEERERVVRLANLFREELRPAGLTLTGRHHITGVHMTDEGAIPRIEEFIQEKGFFVKISEYPSRPRGKPCCRVTFTPMHTGEDVRALAAAWHEATERFI